MKYQGRTGLALWAFAAALAAAVLIGGCSAISAASTNEIPTPARATIPTTSPAGSGGAAQTGDLKRTSQGGSVTVEVTWDKAAASAGGSLRFEVAMNTHSVELDGVDLAKLAVLRNDSGKEVAPERWEAPAGGHHRSGTLTFPGSVNGSPLIDAQTRFIELIVRDVAGVKERSFKWELAS